MSNDSVERQIMSIVAEVSGFDHEDIALDMNLAQDLEIDSIKAIEIIVAIEKKFKISIRDEDIPSIVTIKDAIDLAKRILEQKNKDNFR